MCGNQNITSTTSTGRFSLKVEFVDCPMHDNTHQSLWISNLYTHSWNSGRTNSFFFVDNKLHAEKWFDIYMNMQINFGIKIQNSELYFCLLINVLELLKIDHWKKSQMLIAKSFFLHKMYKSEIFRLITSFSYILMISIDC